MTYSREKNTDALVQLSQEWVFAVKTNRDIPAIKERLKTINLQKLTGSLATDYQKKAFWINIYNGYSQFLLQTAPEQYNNRNRFFSSKQIQVGHHCFSLDDIEHGILRRSKTKWSFGYLNKVWLFANERALRVEAVDYRIHFALNCGAASCPPIAFYTSENLHEELNMATKSYLASEALFDAANNCVYVPRIMLWFIADFGGYKGLQNILKKQGILPQGAVPKINFKPYNWTLQLNHYKKETA